MGRKHYQIQITGNQNLSNGRIEAQSLEDSKAIKKSREFAKSTLDMVLTLPDIATNPDEIGRRLEGNIKEYGKMLCSFIGEGTTVEMDIEYEK